MEGTHHGKMHKSQWARNLPPNVRYGSVEDDVPVAAGAVPKQ